MELDESILLQKQIRDNSEDLRSEFLDLKNWEEEMKRKERELISERNEQQDLPPIRRNTHKKSKLHNNKTTDISKRINSLDYSAWDKFDVEVACEKIDKESDIDFAEKPISKEEWEKSYSIAMKHKEKGNIFVQQKNWAKALSSYNEAIMSFPYDAVFYANRALCHLKLNNLHCAEADCTSAIQLDNSYVKAYHRRAVARMELKQYKEAKEDIEIMLMSNPSDKEARTMLRQVDEQLKKLQPTRVNENISIEKQIAKTMLSEVKSNKKVSDIKKNKDRKNNINVGAGKPPSVLTSKTAISTTESKQHKCIPDWLPEKDNVEIVEAIQKLPHLCCKEPLKKISVQEANLSKPFKEKDEELNNTTIKIQLSDICSDNSAKDKEIPLQIKLENNCAKNDIEIPPVPKTAVQFLINWKKCTTSHIRYKYLKQIPPDNLPKIFQDSMESDIFSSILKTLKTEFMVQQESIFSYLKNLSNIKRFRALIMFLSDKEKQDLELVLTYCKTSEKISTEEITKLRNKYEIQ